MSHENTQTVETKKGSGVWINKRTVNKTKPLNPEQKNFFSKKYKTEKEASSAAEKRSDRYKVRERQRIKMKK
jgi:hypothetical protein